jgi:uncharacterized membrane protein YsdA (DUF1294 family)
MLMDLWTEHGKGRNDEPFVFIMVMMRGTAGKAKCFFAPVYSWGMDWLILRSLAFPMLYLLVNLSAFLCFGYDKRRAVNERWRIPERRLLWLALLGPFGALVGMRVFRHKTRKALFKLVPLFALLHLLVLYILLP